MRLQILTLVAIFLGPVVALYIQRLLDLARARRERKLHIFRVLMSSRSSGLSPAHVEALNSIEVEFYATRGIGTKVIDAWRVYSQHLNLQANAEPALSAWNQRRADLLSELLYVMGQSLGYELEKSVLASPSYYPRGYGEYEIEWIALRKASLEIFRGERPLPVKLVEGESKADVAK